MTLMHASLIDHPFVELTIHENECERDIIIGKIYLAFVFFPSIFSR